MGIEVAVYCDRCARLCSAERTAVAARAELRRHGGQARGGGGRRDLCPSCVGRTDDFDTEDRDA